MKVTVLVTEGVGFIASHVITLLLEKGYRVRATVTNSQEESQLRTLCSESKSILEVVEIGLFQDQGWDRAVKGCRYVIHDASNVPGSASLNNDSPKLNVQCVKRILRACADDGGVKRVVLTSSISAVHDHSSSESAFMDEEKKKIYNESDWSHVDSPGLDIGAQTITLVERAAWDFIRELPEKKKLELSVINPGVVLGPLVCGFPSRSLEIVQKLFERTLQLIPKVHFCVADVRDVAQAHLKVMTLPSAATHRHIVCTESIWWRQIAHILFTEFKPKGYHIPTTVAPFFVTWLGSFFDRSTSMIIPRIGRECSYDNKRMREILGVTPRDLSQTVLDTAYSLIEKGYIQKSKRHRLETELVSSKEDEIENNQSKPHQPICCVH
ncbi:tetraketide alpha-pyrone reductase 2-like isoform X2 [Limulus polyphemus]|uniref:Tetraketide alpha-pyrone reductase 2-like isoform X2 n=1 Tax=Limulus polyphemus TaxID=6850 RepID=A0ABM1SG05_LIMPO|nr:tetraketide alpha-pyrone reductase 2-like isoform X2 [Limulus polyphemus]